MNLGEVLLHESLVEYAPSHSAGAEESDQQAFEGDGGDGKEDIPVLRCDQIDGSHGDE